MLHLILWLVSHSDEGVTALTVGQPHLWHRLLSHHSLTKTHPLSWSRLPPQPLWTAPPSGVLGSALRSSLEGEGQPHWWASLRPGVIIHLRHNLWQWKVYSTYISHINFGYRHKWRQSLCLSGWMYIVYAYTCLALPYLAHITLVWTQPAGLPGSSVGRALD